MFMTTTAEAAKRYCLDVYAVCLMGNHYHQVVATPRGNLSEAMRHVNGVFTQWSNRRHDRTGHLFEGRYRSIVVQQENYLRRAVRYVVRNPVRARLVDEASAWRWSTYRATAGLDAAPEWLKTDWMLWAFDATTTVEAQDKYRAFVNDRTVKKTRVDWSAVAIGSRKFVEAHNALARARLLNRPQTKSETLENRPSLDELFKDIVSREERDCVIVIAHITHGYRLTEISAHLGFHATLASRVFQRFTRASPALKSAG
jgi:REP-associated tyrosine transposase